MPNHEPMFSCQNLDCAAEISYPANMLALWNDEPTCESCYDGDVDLGVDAPRFHELPPFVPEHEKLISELLEALVGLSEVMGKMRPMSGEPFGRAVAELCEARTIIAKAKGEDQ